MKSDWEHLEAEITGALGDVEGCRGRYSTEVKGSLGRGLEHSLT